MRKSFRSWREVSLAPFQQTLFRSLWIAALVSNVGAAMQAVGASWTMTSMSASPQTVALVQSAATLPIVLLALPAGALADNADRRLVMLGSQILGAVSAGALALLAQTGLVTPWSLLGFTALIGAAMALHQPAWQASLADFVPRESLPAAISLNVLAFNAARSMGPALGGTVIAAAGATAAFAINAISFLGLIVVLAVARLPQAGHRLRPEPILPAMTSGLRYVGLSPSLKRIYLRVALFGCCASAAWSLLPLVARGLGGGPMSFGLLMGALGVGSFCGAMLAAWIRAALSNDRIVTFSSAAFAVAALGLGFSPWLALSTAFAFLGGVAWILVFTTTRTCIQLSTPRWVVGRAVSLGQVASFGAMSLGAAGWGALATRIGVAETLIISGVCMAASLLVARVAPLPGTDVVDAAPPPEPRSRPPATTMSSSAGPIVVTIEYDVPHDQTAAFLELINELGRIRRRNGAIRWSIRQDIDRPEIWIESIRCTTWGDHLRRLERYTPADRHLVIRAESFRTRAARPIRRMIEHPVRPAKG